MEREETEEKESVRKTEKERHEMKYKVGDKVRVRKDLKVSKEYDGRIPKGLHYRKGLQLEEISDCKASRKNREQCCANHGRKACRSKLSVSESR